MVLNTIETLILYGCIAHSPIQFDIANTKGFLLRYSSQDDGPSEVDLIVCSYAYESEYMAWVSLYIGQGSTLEHLKSDSEQPK